MTQPTDADKKDIARLAARLGPDVVAELARSLPSPKRGRKKGEGREEKHWEDHFFTIMIAHFLDEQFEEAKRLGHPAPLVYAVGEWTDKAPDDDEDKFDKEDAEKFEKERRRLEWIRREGKRLRAKYRGPIWEQRWQAYVSKFIEASSRLSSAS